MSQKPKIGFYAEDASPCKQGKLLCEGFHPSRFYVCSFLDRTAFQTALHGYGKNVVVVDLAFVWANGTDQSNTIALIDKMTGVGTKVFIVEDTPGAALRLPEEISAKCEGVIAAIPATEHLDDLKLVYEEVEYLGVPGHWESEFKNVTEKPDPLPEAYDPGRKLIVIAGEAIPEYNNDLLTEIIPGIVKAARSEEIDIFFGAHPKDGQTITDEQSKRRSAIFAGTNIIEAPGLSAPKMMSLADIAIVFGAGTNIAERARSGRPLIYYTNDTVKAFLRDRMGCPKGTWWVQDYGGALPSGDGRELFEDIDNFLCPDSELAEELSASQQINFPIPENWNEQAGNLAEFASKLLEPATV